KSVIRAGYGIYYPTSAAQGIRDPIATNPFNQSISKRGTTVPLEGWPSPGNTGVSPLTGGTITSGTNGTPAVNAVPFGLHQPRIHQYNATFEREIGWGSAVRFSRSEEHTSELQSRSDLVCRLLLEKKKAR